MIKKLFLALVVFVFVFTVALFAAEPKFRLHIIKNLAPGFNYSINTPIVIDYDGDSDMDILIISKEGIMYFFENLTIE
jgi:hypothetical protein